MTSTVTVATQAPTTTLHAIELQGLHKSFGDVHAVNGIDLTVAPGEIVAFLGPNGAGKTTTIDMILGLSKPDQGTVEVFGLTPREAISKGLVAAVQQTGGLLRDLTVRDVVEYTRLLYANARPTAEVLERANLTDIAGRRIKKCSGGEQQRVRFALALLPDPELIILDEPTTGMDVEARRQFWNTLRADAKRGKTIFFATHYLEEADDFADRIILLRQGQVVADGSGAHIKSLVSGRTLRATIPGATESNLAGVPDADSIEIRGDAVLISSRDSDAVARYLLNHTHAHDLEIVAHGLEDAFVALTTDSKDAK